MNRSQEKVLQYLTGHENIDSVTVDALQKLVDENPYFPVTYLLLSKKLKTENSADFISQVQQTAIYFSNTYWLDYQLNDYSFPASIFEKPTQSSSPDTTTQITEKEASVISDSKTPVAEELPAQTDFTEQESKTANGLVQENRQESEASADSLPPHEIAGISEARTLTSPVINAEEEVPVVHDNIEQVFFETISPVSEFEPAINSEPVTISNTLTTEYETQTLDTTSSISVPDHQTLILTHNEAESETTKVGEEMAGVTHGTDETTEAFLNEADPANETEIIHSEDSIIPEDAPVELTEEVTEAEEEMAGVTRTADAATEAFLTEASLDEKPESVTKSNVISTFIKNEEKTELDEHERMFLNIKAMLDATSEEADANATDSVIPIDPYYTVDYFASQGIKIELEQNPRDQLGQNLKKFTHWLKHMKKLGPEDATEVIIRQETEADIQQIADSSNTVREVVTEAMASVLEKQGKKDKAVELYNKLSFLNPDKSAYFAGKIKKLKGT